MVSQVGRPDDGTDTTGFFNTEYFVDLKPKEQWRPVFHQDKEELIAAMDRELEKIPGVIWNFSQPIADNMEEAVSGVKGELADQDLRRRSEDARREGRRDRRRDAHDHGHRGSGLFRVLGQPNLNFTVDREQAARYQINVADVQDAIQTAVGGNALTQVCRASSATTWCCAICRSTATRKEAIENIRLLSPSGERVSLAQLCNVADRGRRLGNLSRRQLSATSPSSTACAAAIWAARWKRPSRRSTQQVKLPRGLSHRLGRRIREPEARRSGG